MILRRQFYRLRGLVRYSIDSCRERFARVHPAPIFVLGNQKSGTSAIASLLALAAKLSYTQDFFVKSDISQVASYHDGALSLEAIVSANKRAFSAEIIKDPDLTFFVDDLLRVFPESRFVFIVRDPRQNIRSILNRLEIPGTATSLADHPQVLRKNPGWTHVVRGLAPTIQGSNHIEILAERWNLAVSLFERYKDRVQYLRYEDFNDNKVDAIERLCQSLELPLNGEYRHMLDHEFQPKGKRGAQLTEFFGEENLSLIGATCGQGMQRHGYN